MSGVLDRLKKYFTKENRRPTQPQRVCKENVYRERSERKVENKDFLLDQIDEFREKAQQLHTLLMTKESKVNELQEIVAEREDEAEKLAGILKERQEKVDQITETVGNEINAMADRVNRKLEEIGDTLAKQYEDGRKANQEEIEAVREAIATVTDEIADLKDAIGEKIHSENVKSYRNIQELLKEQDEKLDKLQDLDVLQQNVKGLQGYNKFLTGLGIGEFLVLIVYILYSLGVFQMFM